MKLLIDISDELYQMCRSCLGDADSIERAIANGVPLEQIQAIKIAHKVYSSQPYIDGFAYCSHCNSIVLHSAKYCHDCGYKLESED